MTEQRLRNIAEAYVSRYGGSTGRLRSVLRRRALRSLRYHAEEERRDEIFDVIEALIATRVQAGTSDDAREARAAAVRLSLAGRPRRVVAMKLREKGFAPEHIESAVGGLQGQEEDSVDPDLVACCRYARRRGLGPFRSPGARDKPRDKQLAALMRAGFSYALASRVVDCEDAGELQAILDEAPLPSLSGP